MNSGEKPDARIEEFRDKYAPEKTEEYVSTCLDRMYIGNAPTLKAARDILGDNPINAWLGAQISYMFELTDVQLDAVKTNSLIRLIRAKYPWLKVTEFMHYVFLFRTGEFGKIYGKADGQTVILTLKDYCRMREDVLSDIRRRTERHADISMGEMATESRNTPDPNIRKIIEYMSSPEYRKLGEWRSEPWASLLARDHFVNRRGRFPGSLTYEERANWARSLGYVPMVVR